MRLPGGTVIWLYALTALKMFIPAVTYEFYFIDSVLRNDKNVNKFYAHDIHHRVIFNSKNLEKTQKGWLGKSCYNHTMHFMQPLK